eukprot:scaffold22560_cov135-Cylindrotheca_fusiformis.AAC.10
MGSDGKIFGIHFALNAGSGEDLLSLEWSSLKAVTADNRAFVEIVLHTTTCIQLLERELVLESDS